MLGLPFLAGCSSDGGGDWRYLWDAAWGTWQNRNASVALEDAAAIPFATLGVRVDGGREQIVVLATDDRATQLWAASSKIAIQTRFGRVVRTKGFGTDLSGYYPVGGDSADWKRPHEWSWLADFADLGRYSIRINCDVRPMGADPITILGKTFNTFRVEEACHSESLDWSFTNTYWVSSRTGNVWRSVQHIHPSGRVLELEIIRPPLSFD